MHILGETIRLSMNYVPLKVQRKVSQESVGERDLSISDSRRGWFQ